jgi:hypothetical protein
MVTTLVRQRSRPIDAIVQREQALAQRLDAEEARAEQATRRADRLAEKLRALGVDPDADDG